MTCSVSSVSVSPSSIRLACLALTIRLEATLGAYACDDSRAEDISIYDALQQQLGLKLVLGKANVSVLIVDHAEPPTAN